MSTPYNAARVKPPGARETAERAASSRTTRGRAKAGSRRSATSVSASPASARSSTAAPAAGKRPTREAVAKRKRITDGYSSSEEFWNGTAGATGSKTGEGREPRRGTTTPRSSGNGRSPAGGGKSGGGGKTAGGFRGARAKAATAAAAAAISNVNETVKEHPKHDNTGWVQCDTCHKWRRLAPGTDANDLPGTWFCSMNEFQPGLASCSAPEQYYDTSEVVEIRRGGAPEPPPPKKTRKWKRRDTPPSAKEEKIRASVSRWLLRLAAAEKQAARLANGLRGDGAGSLPPPTRGNRPLKGLAVSAEPTRWVQCHSTACGKWRALPRFVGAERLLEGVDEWTPWYCVMNTWDEPRASCAAPQEHQYSVVDLIPPKNKKKKKPVPGAEANPPTVAAAAAAGTPPAPAPPTATAQATVPRATESRMWPAKNTAWGSQLSLGPPPATGPAPAPTPGPTPALGPALGPSLGPGPGPGLAQPLRLPPAWSLAPPMRSQPSAAATAAATDNPAVASLLWRNSPRPGPG